MGLENGGETNEKMHASGRARVNDRPAIWNSVFERTHAKGRDEWESVQDRSTWEWIMGNSVPTIPEAPFPTRRTFEWKLRQPIRCFTEPFLTPWFNGCYLWKHLLGSFPHLASSPRLVRTWPLVSFSFFPTLFFLFFSSPAQCPEHHSLHHHLRFQPHPILFSHRHQIPIKFVTNKEDQVSELLLTRSLILK
jgi:hypothetical protein